MTTITPIEMMKPVEAVGIVSGKDKTETNQASGIFKDLFTAAVNDVVNTDQTSVIDTENLATGDVDDLHTLSIDNMKSYLAVNMLVQLRNKALDSYNQIMQINV